MSLSTEQIVGIVTVVVGFTELIKLSKYIPDKYGLGIAALLSALGEFLFIYSQPDFAFVRTAIWPVVSAYLVILSAAAGVYGVIRESRGGDVTSAARTGFDGQRQALDDTTGTNTEQREQSRRGTKLPMWLIAIIGVSVGVSGCANRYKPGTPVQTRFAYEVKQSLEKVEAVQVKVIAGVDAGSVQADQARPFLGSVRKLAEFSRDKLIPKLDAYDAASKLGESAKLNLLEVEIKPLLDQFNSLLGDTFKVQAPSAFVNELSKVAEEVRTLLVGIRTRFNVQPAQ